MKKKTLNTVLTDTQFSCYEPDSKQIKTKSFLLNGVSSVDIHKIIRLKNGAQEQFTKFSTQQIRN